MNVQLKKGTLDLCVLSLLCKENRYGYELVSRISEEISMSEGTIYPLLKRLKDDGLVSTYLEESQEGPPRKYYKITAKGINEYQELEREWIRFCTGVNNLIGGIEQ